MYENEEMTAAVGGNYALPDPANHVAICCGIVHLGTVDHTYEGKVTRKKMVRISFELVNTNHVFDEAKGNEPFIVTKEFPFSMNKKAGLRKMLEAWRGASMTDDEAKAFNIVKLITAPCLVNVIIKTSGKGNKYVDIATVSQVPQGTNVPPLRKGTFLFNFNPPFKSDVFNSLPEYVQKVIKTSDEYLALSGAAQQPAPGTNVFAAANNNAGILTPPASAAPIAKMPF